MHVFIWIRNRCGEVRNPDAFFVPGSRVRVRVPVSEKYRAILVPDTAISTDQDKKYLLIVADTDEEKNVVHRRDVQPGKLTDDGLRVILKSDPELRPEESVIVDGLQRARVHYPVTPVEGN